MPITPPVRFWHGTAIRSINSRYSKACATAKVGDRANATQGKLQRRIQYSSDARNPPRAWQRMLSGRRLDLLDPSPLDVEIEDIAHGLARVARWNGQTKGAHAFSVAQHCVLVERLAVEIDPRLAARPGLMALLHDAPEYVVGDLISPFKAAVGIDYKDFELKLLAAIHLRFGLPPKAPPPCQSCSRRPTCWRPISKPPSWPGSNRRGRAYFGTPPRGARPRSGAPGPPPTPRPNSWNGSAGFRISPASLLRATLAPRSASTRQNPRQDMPMILVTPLSAIDDTIRAIGRRIW